MKKLICLIAFAGLGFYAANAQSAMKPSSSATVAVDQEKPASAKTDAKENTDKKKADCSAAEKKSCGSMSGKKSCCAHKSEAKKEEAK